MMQRLHKIAHRPQIQKTCKATLLPLHYATQESQVGVLTQIFMRFARACDLSCERDVRIPFSSDLVTRPCAYTQTH